MTIPKSYEAFAADLASEKIISKTLQGQKEAYMMIADKGRLDLATWKQKACEAAEREAALREELEALRESYEAMRDRKNSIVDLQQRLTVAEQRADEMAHALTIADEYLCAAESLLDRGEDDSLNLEPAIIAVRGALKAALKPAEDYNELDDDEDLEVFDDQ